MSSTAIVDTVFNGKLKIGNTSIGKYCKSYKVTRAMQTTNAETAVNGTTIYDKLGYKYKIEIELLPMTQAELKTLSDLLTAFDLTVTFWNPFKNATMSMPCYINDQTVNLLYYWGTNGGTRHMYDGMSIHFVGKKCYTS